MPMSIRDLKITIPPYTYIPKKQCESPSYTTNSPTWETIQSSQEEWVKNFVENMERCSVNASKTNTWSWASVGGIRGPFVPISPTHTFENRRQSRRLLGLEPLN